MKRTLNIVICFFFLAAFSSCLKDHTIIGPDSPGAVKHVVEFLNPAVISSSTGNPTPLYVFSYDVVPSAKLTIQVSYSGGEVAPNDIHVKVTTDSNGVKASNVEQKATRIPLPDSLYSTSSMDIVIPKGQKIGTLTITISPNKFDLTKSYALGLKIVSVSGTTAPISGNFGLIVVAVGAKNKWDGLYKVTGTFKDLTNATFTDAYPKEIGLTTLGAKSDGYYDKGLNGGMYGYRFMNGASGTYFGNFAPIFNFDDAGNVVSVSNYYGTASQNASTRDAAIDPAGVNKMTFDSNGKPKEMNVSYFMLQGGNIRVKITEKFVYVGSR
jgi:hypothetical protein